VIRLTGHLDDTVVDRLDDGVRGELMAAFVAAHGST
jgi:hypothetical protein